jgi:hypothetical protein
MTNEQTMRESAGEGRMDREAGQAAVLMVAILGTFLIGVLSFAVDMTSFWFHRQETQTAADAACQAGAMDMLKLAQGTTPPSMGFTLGTPGDCTTSATSSICRYAHFNGYVGSGFSPTSASNSVSWTFPSVVTGATKPSSSITNYPFLTVSVEENVKMWFMAMLGVKYKAITSTCTCGISTKSSTAPIVVLAPTGAGTLYYTGGGTIKIYGGPQESIQVDSTDPNAYECVPSGTIDTSNAGPDGTGGDVGVTGGPTPVLPGTCWGGGGGNTGFVGGTTGSYISPSAAIADPYATVAAPTLPATSKTASSYEYANYKQDGCPMQGATNVYNDCFELEPGYYPSGWSDNGFRAVIMKPGIYYMNGNFSIGGSDIVRVATNCTPTCSANTSTYWQQTDGVMIYFLTGQLLLSGGSGGGGFDSIASTMLTCDGSAPPAAVGIPSTINGSILVAQCSAGGTYVGPGSSDIASSTGSRGLLVFNGHSDTVTSDTFSGSATLAYSGTMYYHNTTYSDVFSVSGGASSGTYMLGQIVADKIKINGSGAIKMALGSAASVVVLKVSILQ